MKVENSNFFIKTIQALHNAGALRELILFGSWCHLRRNTKLKEDEVKKYFAEYLKAAHKHSIFNQKEIMESELCGCFSYLETFSPDEIFY
jgi:RNA recognition motif-containing protein